MSALNPTVHEEFKKGQFVVRKTSTFWSGVSPDLCFEQTLMVSLKGSTGLTKGKVYLISAVLFGLYHGQVS